MIPKNVSGMDTHPEPKRDANEDSVSTDPQTTDLDDVNLLVALIGFKYLKCPEEGYWDFDSEGFEKEVANLRLEPGSVRFSNGLVRKE